MNNQQLISPTDDFWNRQHNGQTDFLSISPFGIPTTISTNQPDVLQAARLSARRFSQADIRKNTQLVNIQIVVQPHRSSQAVPQDLPAQLTYTGLGPWLTISAGEWGHGFANLETRQVLVVLSASLASEIRLVSRYFIDHYLLNFILTDWAMLHASGVLSPDKQRLVVMIAPHNTGKSTTALHLLRAGYTFLADGMALFRAEEGNIIVGGYPIGEVKLRDDVLEMFSIYSGKSVQVREQQKTVVDLRTDHLEQLAETVAQPTSFHLCFLQRANTSQSQLRPISFDHALSKLTDNTIFWNQPAELIYNSRVLTQLLKLAHCHQLVLGTDLAHIIATIAGLA